MSQAAPKSKIEQLHEALATHLLSVFSDPGSMCEACGRSKVDPRVLATAAKFVKENDVEADQGDQVGAVGFVPRIPVDDLSEN